VLAGVVITLIGAVWLRIMAAREGGLRVWHIGFNGLLYVTYLAIVLL
jgi:cation:H+ antiporter